MIGGFISFYVVFVFILYPLKHVIAPTSLVHSLTDPVTGVSKRFHPAIYALEEWPLGLFYVVSELWASVVCQLVFWQLANEVTSLTHAKANYPLIGACGNLGMVFAGFLLRSFANRRDVLSARGKLYVCI